MEWVGTATARKDYGAEWPVVDVRNLKPEAFEAVYRTDVVEHIILSCKTHVAYTQEIGVQQIRELLLGLNVGLNDVACLPSFCHAHAQPVV